ncbi:MAG: c-type cytochrome biogenesis protein CcmI [Rhodospirillales bacterium]
MLFWIVAAALTALVVALVLHPLMRRTAAAAPAAAHDLAVYRDQMAEVDRDLARGLIGPVEAEAARAEIGRRMLLAADAAEAPAAAPPPAAGPTRIAAMAVIVGIPLLALAVYLPAGRPDLPAQPLATRGTDPSLVPAEVVSALANLQDHLKDTPDDLSGWVLLANTYVRMQRYPEAAEAFRRAAILSNGSPDLVSALGEALILANRGIVSEEAARAFEAVLRVDPGEPRARFYIALSRAQAGDARGAMDRWAALIAEGPADAPWIPQIVDRVRDTARIAELDPAPWLPRPGSAPPPAPPPSHRAAPAGVPPGGAELARLPAAEQSAAIRGMVDGLAARLAQNPGDVEGWLRLARARMVLGDQAAAAEALGRALEAAPDRLDIRLARAESLLALRPEGEERVPDTAAAAFRDILERAPDEPRALWWVGMAAVEAGRRDEALALWTRLRDGLPAGSEQRREVEAALAAIGG